MSGMTIWMCWRLTLRKGALMILAVADLPDFGLGHRDEILRFDESRSPARRA